MEKVKFHYHKTITNKAKIRVPDQCASNFWFNFCRKHIDCTTKANFQKMQQRRYEVKHYSEEGISWTVMHLVFAFANFVVKSWSKIIEADIQCHSSELKPKTEHTWKHSNLTQLNIPLNELLCTLAYHAQFIDDIGMFLHNASYPQEVIRFYLKKYMNQKMGDKQGLVEIRLWSVNR